jgi:integrase
VSECITQNARKYSLGSKEWVYTSRHFLRFLYDAGVTTEDFSLAIPETLPRKRIIRNGFTEDEVSQMLDAVDKGSLNGKRDYAIIPSGLTKKKPRYTPYIYSKDEISAVWKAFDAIEPKLRYPTRHLVMSAIVRLLYCYGLRPAEARMLKSTDVDLTCGKLFIRESKGHKDRIVMMSPDVTEYMRDYDRAINRILRKRAWFFSNESGDPYDPSWLNRNFGEIRKQLNLPAVCGVYPRLYDFRHTFSTHRLYEWMREGKDLDVMLPYLSAYMGHAQLSDTYYYIHLVPEQFETLSGVDFTRYEALLPEVECDE